MREAVYHGLLLEFSVELLEPGPGLPESFSVDSVKLVKVQDMKEFRSEHPFLSPTDVLIFEADKIDRFLYEEVRSGRA